MAAGINLESMGASLLLDNKQFIAACLESVGISEAAATAINAAFLPISAVLTIVAASFGALVFVLNRAKEAGIQVDRVFTSLSVTMERTGRAANTSAKDVREFADLLASESTFDDTSILKVYNAFARYKDIPTAQLWDWVRASMDLSAATGITLDAAMNQIIQAMATGEVSTLRFDRALKDQISTTIQAGKADEARKLILQGLSQYYGGEASAALDTYEGKVRRIENAFADWFETIGVFTQNQELLNFLDKVFEIMQDLGPIVELFGKVVFAVFNGVFVVLNQFANDIGNMIKDIANSLDALFKGDFASAGKYAEQLVGDFMMATMKSQGYMKLFIAGVAAGWSEYDGIMEKWKKSTAKGQEGSEKWKDNLNELIAYLKELQAAITHFNEAELSFFQQEIKYFADIKKNVLDIAAAQKKYNDDYLASKQELLDKEEIWQAQMKGLLRQGLEVEADALQVRIAQEKAAMQQRILDEKKANQKIIDDAKAAEEAIKKAHKDSINQMIVDLVKYQLMRDGVFSNADFNTIIRLMQNLGMISAEETAQALADWQYAMGMITQYGGTITNPVANMDYPHLVAAAGGGGGGGTGVPQSGPNYNPYAEGSRPMTSSGLTWVPLIPGLVEVKGHASGGNINPNLPAIVGEEGPELLFKNNVRTASQTRLKGNEVELGQNTINKLVFAINRGQA